MGHQQKSYKKFVATAASATLVASAIVPVASASFSDVAENNEFATYINTAVEAGYVKGYEDGTFGINDNLKRSQVVIIIGRYLEKLGYTSEKTTSPWSDVTSEEVIKYGNIVKDAEVFTGYANGTLNGAGLITRENMAVVLDRLAKTVTGTSLSDVATDIEDIKVADLATANADYQAAIQALRDLGISTADNFNPKGNVKRGQFAKFIVTTVEKINAIEVTPEVTVEDIKKEIEAVDATLPVVEDITADNAEDAKAAVEAAKTAIAEIEAGIAEVELTEEEVAELNKAIEAVEAKYDAIVKAADKVIEAAKPLAVESVTAINATTLTVTGNKLGELKVEDMTVSSNTVAAVTASVDGKSATVTLGAAFIPNQEYKVAVKVGEETKAFTVKHALAATTVTVDSKSYDDDTQNQYVSFNVNGKLADLNDLFVNGYTVTFKATKIDAGVTTDATAELFANTTTGLLKTNLKAGSEYKLQVTIAKGSDIIVSERADIKIVNNQLAATAVKSLKVTNNNGTSANTDDFELVSSTLVVGETLTFSNLVAVQNGIETSANLAATIKAGTASVVSSNPAVASVSSTGVVTANTPGTVTVTVTYGKATKEYNLTVAQEKREFSKFEADSYELKTGAVLGKEFKFVAKDQFGDPIVLANTAYTATIQDTSIVTRAALATTNNKGEGKITVSLPNPLKPGTTAVAIKNNSGVTVGSFAVTVTQNETIANQVLETQKPTEAEILAGQSADLTLDKATEQKVDLELVKYTSENVKVGAQDLDGYKVKFDKNVVKVNTNNTGELTISGTTPELTIEASVLATAKLGYTDIQLYDKAGKLVGTQRVTVADNTPKLTGLTVKEIPAITFAGKTVNYKDLLTITETAGDDIVSGASLSVEASSVVRIVDATGTSTTNGLILGDLYLDVNGDGKYNVADKDIKLGKVEITKTSDSNDYLDVKGIIAGASTGVNAKGTLLITVKDNSDTPKIVSSSSITVNVPE